MYRSAMMGFEAFICLYVSTALRYFFGPCGFGGSSFSSRCPVPRKSFSCKSLNLSRYAVKRHDGQVAG